MTIFHQLGFLILSRGQLLFRGWHCDFLIRLRILTGKNHSQIKLQGLQKVPIWAFGSLVHQINPLQEVLTLKQNFEKNKAVTGKTPFFVICINHFIRLNIGF